MVQRVFLNEFSILDAINIYLEKEISTLLEQLSDDMEYNDDAHCYISE